MNVHNLVFRDSMTVNYNNLIKFKIFFFISDSPQTHLIFLVY